MTTPPVRHLQVEGRRIGYRLREGAFPVIVFLPGYGSDMEGAKATALDAFAGERGLAMLRLDYSGSSGGRFEDGTLDAWLQEVLSAIDQLTEGPLVLVGSSMGGWLALHVAIRRPERVQALVGIAAAADFTAWGFPDGVPEDGQVSRAFWESGQRMLLLGDAIGVDCPVRLIHGEKDEAVPLGVALRTLAALRSGDVQLTVIKDGGHRLSEPHEIAAILRTVADLAEPRA
ncbi:alpha/beta hydrolase [Sphingomonas sp.]|uniref:alpha/beta fold hydrolase n=1 Tax=Sphingomonas sp. TaxID=28214 RepID=UPI0025F3F2BB|nr:alpha/beta hydrolase [Sphingomonas sp.]MBV9528782.1 alpha/beta hydrolase [Sphingomonas sp.]